jgi:hypothetical protein
MLRRLNTFWQAISVCLIVSILGWVFFTVAHSHTITPDEHLSADCVQCHLSIPTLSIGASHAPVPFVYYVLRELSEMPIWEPIPSPAPADFRNRAPPRA